MLRTLRRLFVDTRDTAQIEAGTVIKVYGEDLKNSTALINRANKRAVTGDVTGAREDYDEAIDRNPTKATAYFNRGFFYRTLGDYETAIRDFSRAIELLPTYDEAYYQRGMSRAQIHDLPGAIADYTQAIAVNPFCIKAYYKRAESRSETGDTQGALIDYTQAVLRVPKDPNAYYQRGRLLSNMGKLSNAIEDFTATLQFNPKHADAYYQRGYCLLQLGDSDRAAEDFSQALLYNPSHEAAYHNRLSVAQLLKGVLDPPQDISITTLRDTAAIAAQAHLEATAVEVESVDPQEEDDDDENPITTEGEPAFHRTTKLEPETLDGYFERAQNRTLNGELEGAIADYTQILQLDPMNVRAYYQRGQVRSALGDTETAVEDLNQSIHWARIASLKRIKEFNQSLSDTLRSLKQKPEDASERHSQKAPPIETSLKNYTQAIQANPRNAQAYFQRAQCRALIGDLKGAIADYTRTLELNPHHTAAYYRRGQSRAALGALDDARQDFNQAIRQRPTSGTMEGEQRTSPSAAPTDSTDAERYYHQGLAQAKVGDKQGSLKFLGQALTLFLKHNQVQRYEETLQLIQKLSHEIS